MIYADLKDAKNYCGLDKNLDTAINYVLTHNLSELKKGRNEVDGENVYINFMSYTTMKKEDAFFEAHVQYLDVHILLEGEEMIGVSDISSMKQTDSDPATDYVGYEGEIQSSCYMAPGKMLVAFPSDAHMVKVQANGESHVRKAVVKVKITE